MKKNSNSTKAPVGINIWQALERPPVNAEIYRMSPQVRKIPKNSVAFIAISIGKKNYNFVLKKLVTKAYDQYGAQDLRTGIYVGSASQIFSGKWDATSALVTKTPFKYPWFVPETRTEQEEGMPHSLISNSSGAGFHDNYTPIFEDVFIAADQNKSVYLKIENQSTIHDHALELSFLGWRFSPKCLEVYQ